MEQNTTPIDSSLVVRSAHILLQQLDELVSLWEREKLRFPAPGEEELRRLLSRVEAAMSKPSLECAAVLRQMAPSERRALDDAIQALATSSDLDNMESARVLGRLRSAIWGPDATGG